MGAVVGLYPAVYPDIRLWEEITLLKHFAKNKKWVVENVIPYYEPIVKPSFTLDRHYFWANFYVPFKLFKKREVNHKDINGSNHTIFGYDLSAFKVKNKRHLLRNMVNPQVGKHIFDRATGSISTEKQGCLFPEMEGA